MSLLAQLRTAKPLRKVGGIQHDASVPNLTNTLEISARYDTNVLSANIENWAALLGPYTSKTLLIPLTQEHAKILKQAYEDLEKEDNMEIVEQAAEEYVRTGRVAGFLNSQEENLFEKFGDEIQTKINELGGRCFVKLSSRSPKDACARSGVFQRLYQDQIIDEERKLRQLSENEKLRILCEADGKALCFTDARDVIRALVLSERVWQDMTLAFRHPEKWNQNIVFRDWDPVPIDLEFRTFISSNKITCISQYAYQLYSPLLNEPTQRPEIIRTILEFFSSLKPLLAEKGFSDYVLDIGVIPTSTGDWRATLIEMNPFEETTDGALFSWNTERDLLEGKADGETYPIVRVTERPRPGALAMIPKGFKEVVEKVEREFRV